MTWLLFAILSLLSFASADLFSKKNVDSGDVYAPVKMLICTGVLAFLISIAGYALGLGESGLAPWQLLAANPLILLALSCFYAYWILFLVSLRYVGLSINEAFSGTTGILYFAGLVSVNLFCGQLTAVKDMLHPWRLIPILIVLIFTFLLPNVEVIAGRFSGVLQARAKEDRAKTLTSLVILFFALIFDAAETLITTVIFDEEKIGLLDYTTALYSAAIIPVILLSLFLRKKTGRFYIPFKDDKGSFGWYAGASILSSLLYLLASSFDAVRTGIVFIAEPVVPLIGAWLFLKERYTWRQYICIWSITIAAIAFCIIDNIL